MKLRVIVVVALLALLTAFATIAFAQGATSDKDGKPVMRAKEMYQRKADGMTARMDKQGICSKGKQQAERHHKRMAAKRAFMGKWHRGGQSPYATSRMHRVNRSVSGAGVTMHDKTAAYSKAAGHKCPMTQDCPMSGDKH